MPTTDYERKVREQRDALAAYRAGTPSALPATNRFRARVEAHRWGRHHARPMPHTCPVCAAKEA